MSCFFPLMVGIFNCFFFTFTYKTRHISSVLYHYMYDVFIYRVTLNGDGIIDGVYELCLQGRILT